MQICKKLGARTRAPWEKASHSPAKSGVNLKFAPDPSPVVSLNTRWLAQNRCTLAIAWRGPLCEPGTIVALNDSAIAIRWDESGV